MRTSAACLLLACEYGSSEVSDPGWLLRSIRLVPCNSVSCCSQPACTFIRGAYVLQSFAVLLTHVYYALISLFCGPHLSASVTLRYIQLVKVQ